MWLAEAQRQAALRELVRQARPSDSGARRSALIQHIGASMTPNTLTDVSTRPAHPSVPSRSGGADSAAPVQKAGAARTRLLLEGPIVSTLLRLAAPNVVVNVVLIAVTASVDAHFVGKLGPGALAGLSLVFPLLMLMQQMANSSMGGAIASAIARSIGSGRRDDASALVVHGLLIAGGMATLFTALLIIAGPTIYSLMGGRGEVLASAVEYSRQSALRRTVSASIRAFSSFRGPPSRSASSARSMRSCTSRSSRWISGRRS